MYLANCSPGCSNGGTCTRPNVCTCPYGWTGSTCKRRMYENVL